MYTLQVIYEDSEPAREVVTVEDLAEVAARVPYLMTQHPEAARIVVTSQGTRLFQVECHTPVPASQLH